MDNQGKQGIKIIRISRSEHCRRYFQKLLKRITAENDIQKYSTKEKPLGRPRLRWENRIKENVEKVKPKENWKELSYEREVWRRTLDVMVKTTIEEVTQNAFLDNFFPL